MCSVSGFPCPFRGKGIEGKGAKKNTYTLKSNIIIELFAMFTNSFGDEPESITSFTELSTELYAPLTSSVIGYFFIWTV